MRSFCVECGREAPVYQGLCQVCLPKRRSFLELPPFLDLPECPHCGSFRLPGGWREASLEDALRDLINASARVPREVLHHHLNTSSISEDARNLRVEVSATVHLEGMTVQEARQVKVRIKKEACPTCSRQKGQYYEAIIQLRALDRDVTEDEMRRARRLIRQRVRSTKGLFVTREEEVHGGLDVYLSSSEAAKSLVQALKAAMGGSVTSSPRLHTRRQGRDVYRVTYLLRLPGFGPGDVVEVDGRLYQILSLGEKASAVDLERGETTTLRSRELRRARRVEARVVEGIVVSHSRDEIQVMDQDTYETHLLRRPPGLPAVERVKLVITDAGTFVVGPVERA